MAEKYMFTGHESFYCKRLWLKKGYDAIVSGTNFSSPESVVKLGVGKNMVASIRYWMKATGCLDNNLRPTTLAYLLFDEIHGFDPYVEDDATLWLLHYNLIKKSIASIYRLAFLGFKREKKEFTKEQLMRFIQRICSGSTSASEASISKDLRVFLQMYVPPVGLKYVEDYGALFIDLGLIRHTGENKFVFMETLASAIPNEVLLYALFDYRHGGKTVSVDGMQDLSLIFGLPMPDLVKAIAGLAVLYPDNIAYSDNSGIKNVQFINDIDPINELKKYYSK